MCRNSGDDSKTVRILFAGAYGIQNAGDDLPLIALCDQLKGRYPQHKFEFRVLTRHLDQWEQENYQVTQIQNLEYESREEAQGKWFNGLNPGDDKIALETVKQEIKQSDLLVLGAGNALLDITIDLFRGPVPLMALYCFLAKLYHCPVMLYGMSIGPLNTDWGKDLSRGILESADVVTVRDGASRGLANNLLGSQDKVIQLPDPTLMTSSGSYEDRSESILRDNGISSLARPYIAVAVRDLGRSNSAEMDAGFKQAMKELIESYSDSYDFLFIPQSTYQHDDDRECASEIISRITTDNTYAIAAQRLHPYDLINLYKGAILTIAVRLHGAVFSAISATPVIAINYLPKVAGFMQTINSEQYCLDLPSLSADRIKVAMEQALENSEQYSARLRQSVEELRAQSAAYTELVYANLKSNKAEIV